MIIARVLTLFYISAVATETKADIEAINKLYEVNPLQTLLFNLQTAKTILSVFLIPALSFATYMFFRRRTKQGKVDIDSLTFYVHFVIMIVILDIFNNLALLFGRMV